MRRDNTGPEIRAAIAAWARCFNEGDFFAAHEALEPAWLEAAEPEKTFLKGLIHAAVALHHYQRGNAHGARVKYRSALRYLRPYRPECQGVAVGELIEDVGRFLAPLLALPPHAPLPPGGPWPRVRLVAVAEMEHHSQRNR